MFMLFIEYNFKAIPSGDHESFCFDVDRETYVQIVGDEPDEMYDKSVFNEDMYRIYPDQFFRGDDTIEIQLKVESK